MPSLALQGGEHRESLAAVSGAEPYFHCGLVRKKELWVIGRPKKGGIPEYHSSQVWAIRCSGSCRVCSTVPAVVLGAEIPHTCAPDNN